MDRLFYENQGTNTYLVHKISQDEVVDSMTLGMLTNNMINGLATTIYTQMDADEFVKYNVSAKVPVSQFFVGSVNKKRLLGVFKGIVNAMISVEEYMIDTNSLVLDLDYIFADVSTCETVLVCLPINDLSIEPVNLKEFFKNIIFTTQFDQTENCDYIAKIINYLNGVQIISLEDFKSILDSIENSSSALYAQPVAKPAPVAQPVQQAQPVQPVVQQQTVAKPVQPAVPQQPVVNQQPAPAKQPIIQKPVAPPPVVKPATPVAQAAPATEEPVQKMSMMYLLQHYNKENAAAYKVQKEAKKNGSNAVAIPDKKDSKKKDKSKPVAKPAGNVNFAVPGQSAPADQNFAIPGQTPPSVASMATPAQPMQNKQPAVQTPVAQPVQQSVPMSQPIMAQPPVTPQTQAMNFGETTVLSAVNIGETTVLSAVSNPTQPQPHLVRAKNNEKINLDKPVFRIGKEKSYVDYFIGDNTAISRSHANIVCRDGECFVVDTNSTNHTYVNGSMIQSNVETKLENGDKIRLANEEFEFKLF